MTRPFSYDAARQGGIESSTPVVDTTLRRRSPVRHGRRSASGEPSRLHKPLPTPQHARAASGQLAPPQPQVLRAPRSLQNLQRQDGTQNLLGMLAVPPPLATGGLHPRDAAQNLLLPTTPISATGSTPTTPNYTLAPVTPISTPSSEQKKHALLRKKRDKQEEHGPLAWIAGHADKPAYDVDALVQGRAAAELWDSIQGNCLVHLFPAESGRGPSFRVDSTILESSPVLRQVLAEQAMHTVQPVVMHLYLRLKLSPEAISRASFGSTAEPAREDLQVMIDYRNLFAFLCGQSLVATEARPSLFSIFIAIASLLKAYQFSNIDGTSLGEVAAASFEGYILELELADVRMSREKTIEAIVLGERMKSATLYTEAFTHAVGKLGDIVALNSRKFEMITSSTRNRLSRASIDLEKREEAVRLTLKDFDFPQIFSGIMSSKTAEERKEGVRFDAWKDAFFNTRKWMLATLKQQYGDWPPKARSRKNDLEVSGLQRQVLRQLYLDLCSVYDLLVDRNQLTTRTVDGIDRAGPVEPPQVRALRHIESEFDRSSPPVKPPVPFDLPRLPTLATTRRDFGSNLAHDAKLATKKLKDEELAPILRASWNDDTLVTPFLNAFRDMERRAAHGCTLQEIIDLRMGQWIFMYTVLQSLPMLACDAPFVQFSDGVDYFLCEAPRDAMPWVDGTGAQKKWFAVGEAGSVVSLPAHLLEHGVEGIYRRSHCWIRAQEWAAANPLLNQALQEQTSTAASASTNTTDLQLPQVRDDRSRSPSRNSWRHGSFDLGLEALSIPKLDTQESLKTAPPVHKVDSAKTFDAIFATMDTKKTKKK